MSPVESTRASAWRVGLTIFVTLLIVGAEFALLAAIYQRAAPTRAQRLVVSRLEGELLLAQNTSSGQIAADSRAADTRLAQLSLPHSSLAAVRSASDRLASTAGSTNVEGAASDENAADPTVAAELTDLRTAVTALGNRLAARQRSLDLQAHLSYIALLIGVSIGWAVWFRKLVNRHRGLQAQITEQQARAASENRLAALVRNSSDVVAVCDLDATVSFVTQSVEGVLGLAPEVMVGQRWVDQVLQEDTEQFLRALGYPRPGEDGPIKSRMRHADGRILDVEGTVTNLLHDEAVAGLVVTIRDVTARVTMEKQLTHQAFHDALTGLANRQLFGDRLSHALEKRSNVDHPLVVLFCDLDEFKNINDSLGHGIGDRVLTVVAERAAAVIRSGDTVARLGGDEFAVLMEDVELAEAEEIAGRMQVAIGEPISVDGRSITVLASIGLARALPGEMDAEEALRNADVAMYLAKSRGKGTIAQYESQLHADALERLSLRAELQRGIREGQLRLHFQPTVDLKRGGTAGFEALVRWEHPTRGMIPPLLFIPMAEETGLIRPLGSWVLRTACVAAVQLNATLPAGSRRVTMAVNVGAQQLADPAFVDEVLLVLAETGLPATQLTLEITESVVLQDLAVVIERLTALRARGIRIAIDDFGTGYSSLAYLRNLPVDIVKIDKSFIDNIITDAQDAALAEGILAMSIGMSLQTVAEGIEHADQAEWLTAANCVYGQGYFWSRPVPLAQAAELLTGRLRPAPLMAEVVAGRVPPRTESSKSQLLL